MIKPKNDEIIPDFDKETMKELSLDLFQTSEKSVVVVNMVGYIDTYNTQFLNSKMQKVFKKFNKIIFNLSGINYVSSTGIGAFTSFLKVLKHTGGDMALINVQPKVFEVFQLLGFSQFFNMPNTVEEAIVSLSGGEIEEKPTFPATVKCPICSKKLRTSKAGKFRCPQCKQIVAIDETASIKIV